MINIHEFMEKNIFDDNFYDVFYRYIDCVQKLQLLLDYNGLDLSSHSTKIVSISDLNDIYFKLTGSENIIVNLNLLKRELYDICNVYLLNKEGEFSNGK